MPTTSASPPSKYDSYNQAMWEKIIAVLRPLARKYIANPSMTSWNGQEDDLIQDIVQETVVRTFLQMQKAERGERPPIISLELFAKRVMRNHLLDVMRKESRVIHLSDNTVSPEDMPDQIVDPSEMALEEIEMEALFTLIAQVIAKLPEKQQTALLSDLATRTVFTDEQTPLQKALIAVNINLENYQGKLSEDAVFRHKRAALLAVAYKKIRLAIQPQLLE